jgi:hypothetical protein
MELSTASLRGRSSVSNSFEIEWGTRTSLASCTPSHYSNRKIYVSRALQPTPINTVVLGLTCNRCTQRRQYENGEFIALRGIEAMEVLILLADSIIRLHAGACQQSPHSSYCTAALIVYTLLHRQVFGYLAVQYSTQYSLYQFRKLNWVGVLKIKTRGETEKCSSGHPSSSFTLSFSCAAPRNELSPSVFAKWRRNRRWNSTLRIALKYPGYHMVSKASLLLPTQLTKYLYSGLRFPMNLVAQRLTVWQGFWLASTDIDSFQLTSMEIGYDMRYHMRRNLHDPVL